MKKLLPTILLVTVVYFWYFLFYTPAHPQTLEVLGEHTNVTLYTQPESGHAPLLTAINTAQSEILIAMYLLSDKQIITALTNAQAQGVDVKVMLEEHPFGAGNLNQKTKKMLDDAGIENKWSNPAFALTHSKMLVIDGSEAIILNQNLTKSAFEKNREYNIFDTNPQDVLEARTLFIHDWERTTFTPSKTTNLIISPNTSRAALTTLIENASETIVITAETVDDSKMITLLSKKAKTTRIRLLTPTLDQLPSNKKALAQLSSEGVEIKTIATPYMHAKMILVDGEKAYIGSINFSSYSLDENREIGIIITEAESLQKLSESFARDWETAGGID
jgi:cardiolipin synthase A/B